MTDPSLYRLLDVGFVAFHTVWVGFNLLGWIWQRTRRLHLLAIGTTLLFFAKRETTRDIWFYEHRVP